MNEIEMAIMALLSDESNSAADMTSELKELGNGSMRGGIKFIADYFEEIGLTKGKNMGMIKGVFIGGISMVGIVWGLATISQKRAERKIDEQGKKILAVLQKESDEETEDEENNDSTGKSDGE